MTNVRIGSVPWFAGVWWLALSVPAHALARITFRTGWWSAARRLIAATNWCCAMSLKCALEAGAEKEE